ncbi:hypothetical protein JB92DRAFT_3128164 [Gautieria morchelliformis]|nr:hypothetical protein JB92DRAFT_3128164 [Gautieria morchelliformis]
MYTWPHAAQFQEQTKGFARVYAALTKTPAFTLYGTEDHEFDNLTKDPTAQKLMKNLAKCLHHNHAQNLWIRSRHAANPNEELDLEEFDPMEGVDEMPVSTFGSMKLMKEIDGKRYGKRSRAKMTDHAMCNKDQDQDCKGSPSWLWRSHYHTTDKGKSKDVERLVARHDPGRWNNWSVLDPLSI